jgi:hypothetical protein
MNLPYDYYPAVLYAIDKISQGLTETAACDEANIKIATFRNYIKNDSLLQEQLAEAEQRGRDAMADALVQIDNHSIYGQSNPQMAKVVSDNIKWLLSKRDAKRFGEKLEVTHNITADRAITDALNAGRRRAALSHDEDDFIDVTPIIVQTEEEILAEILS